MNYYWIASPIDADVACSIEHRCLMIHNLIKICLWEIKINLLVIELEIWGNLNRLIKKISSLIKNIAKVSMG